MDPRNIQGKKLISFSKALSKLLRHDAVDQGLNIRPDGFIPLKEVVQVNYIKKFNPSFADVQAVVEENNKKRFELVDDAGEHIIRAVQGHSMNVVQDKDLLLPITLDNWKAAESAFQLTQVNHGTYRKVLEFITQDGLCRMTRNHIHMASGIPGKDEVISGMRNSCEVVVELNLTQAVSDGVPFFLSANKVILSPGLGEKGLLPPQYFRSVRDLKTNAFYQQQPFDFICVYDLECNCSNTKGEIAFNETIELPVVIVDVKAQKVVSEFHTYVRPTLEQGVTAFCTELTGITSEQVTGPEVPTITEALERLHKHLLDFGIFKHEFVFMSCGDFDGNQMGREAAHKGYPIANYFKRWINLKKTFPHLEKGTTIEGIKQFDMSAWESSQAIKKAKPTVGGMPSMLEACGLELEGRHHSGIDDARNIARCLIKLLERGYTFSQAMVHNK